LALVVLSVVEQRLDAVRAVLGGAEVTEVAAGLGVHRSIALVPMSGPAQCTVVPNDPGSGLGRGRGLAGADPGERRALRRRVGTDYFVGTFSWGDIVGDDLRRSFDLFAEHVAAPMMAIASW
jgi:hypothetical protein